MKTREEQQQLQQEEQVQEELYLSEMKNPLADPERATQNHPGLSLTKQRFMKPFLQEHYQGFTSILWITLLMSLSRFSASTNRSLGSLCTGWSRSMCTLTDPLFCVRERNSR